jgi:aspartate kinase
MKFGGVGLQDAAAMRHAAKVIKNEEGEKIVVASALKGVTDAIQNNLEAITHDEARAHILMSELRKVHLKTVEDLKNEETRENCQYGVEKTLDHLERLLFGITYTEELTPRSQDLALSFGERLSARILAAYLLDEGVPSEAHDADKLGLVTNGPFGWASPDLVATERNLKERLVPLVKSSVPVVTGFFGADKRGHTTILGRGGSDFSAAIIANATDASVLEVWKETTGFMTADPRAVPAARRVDAMSYDEAAELANFGAKILHPRTVEPVSAKKIPIRIRELKNPASPGTLIKDLESAPACFVRSVAARKQLNIIKLVGPGMGYTPGVAAEVFDVMRKEQINVINMAASEATFALLLDAADGKRAAKALQSTRGGVIQDIVLEEKMALVAIVGKGLGERVGSAAALLSSVSAAKVNIHMISLGASNIAINFVVKEPDAEPALRAVHAAFIEKEQP